MEMSLALSDEFQGEIVRSGDHPAGMGVQVVIRFPNGYGASIIETPWSYGVELAVLTFEDGSNDYDLTYDTPITDDVMGWLDRDKLTDLLTQIKALPARHGEIDSSSSGELTNL